MPYTSEKLIELLKYCSKDDSCCIGCERWGYDCGSAKCVNDLMSQAAAALKSVQQWIPVSERLPSFYPNKRRKVLVTLEDDQGKRFTTTAKYDEENSEWCEFARAKYSTYRVLAWMLKPECYDAPA